MSRTKRQGEIYIVEEEDSGRIKIGYAADSLKRLKTHQTSNSHDLILRDVFRCDDDMARSLEKQLHARFAESRLRNEWFALDWQTVKAAIPEEEERFRDMNGVDEAVDTSLPTVWCLYPRRSKKTVIQFLNKQFITLGFGGLGDLTKLDNSLEAFRQAWEKHHSYMSAGEVRAFYPMFYSFVHRATTGDLVLLPVTWLDKTIHVGRISGPYEYKRWRLPKDLRPVTWFAQLQRSQFSSEALRGIQVNLAFFRVRQATFLHELAKYVQDLE
jgi:hypothetical protein